MPPLCRPRHGPKVIFKMSKIQTCYGKIHPAVFARLSKIKLLVLDVDGTLTDGGIYLDNSGLEFKRFNTKDGYGIVALQKSGVKCAVITGRNSELVRRRCADELKMEYVIQGHADKGPELTKLRDSLELAVFEVAALGDDMNDLPLFRNAGFSACPADAASFIRSTADLVLRSRGGHGAARELCDLIMMAHGSLNPDGSIV